MILLIDPDRGFAERVSEAITDVLVRHVEDEATGERLLEERAGEVDVIALGPGLEQESALDSARKLHERYPHVSLVLGSASQGSGIYREAMRAGVDDVLPHDADTDEIRDVLTRAIEESLRLRVVDAPPPAPAVATTVATFSTKGGCGKSFVATNLAVMLAERYPGEVVLVDLDLQAGDAGIMLQLVPERGILEAAEMGEDLDETALRGFLTPRDKLFLLAAPEGPAQAEQVSPEDVIRILSQLRQMFRWVVIDGPPAFTEWMLAALDLVDTVLVLASLDVPSIKNLRLSVNTLRDLGVPRQRMQLVLNRADSKVGLNVREVEKSLGTTIDLTLPSSREVPFAVNQGIAIVAARPKAPISKALYQVRDAVEKQELRGAGDQGTGDPTQGAWHPRR
jgi:pilus assembly protein CpaE